MGKRLTGSVLPHGDRYRAYVGREYLGLYETEQEGWDVVNAWLAIEGKHGRAPDILRAFAHSWFEQRELDGHVRGVVKERSVWRSRIECAEFIDWPMRRIKPRHVQVHLRKLLKRRAQYTLQTSDGPQRHNRDRTLSRQSVVHAWGLLKRVLDDAVIEGKLPTNPAREVRMPKRDDPGRDGDLIVYATAEEVARLFALELPPFERTVFTIAIYCGLRMGEIWGLRWEDIVLDGESPHIRVRRSYDGPPKSKFSLRDVPALPPVVTALEGWKRRGGIARIGGLVFPAHGGGCRSEGFDAGWSGHRERIAGELSERTGWRTAASIRPEVTFHCLRHTCACLLLQGTWVPALLPRPLSLLELKHWLGHSTIAVTERHYARLAPGNLHDAVRGDKPKINRTGEGDET